ncbi:hypothetical protein ABIE45_001242 [Methylobacterium sp. OAE515]
MFVLPPSASEMGDLQLLADAIDALCEILDGDREILIEGLTEIVRRRVEFERLRHDLSRGVAQD